MRTRSDNHGNDFDIVNVHDFNGDDNNGIQLFQKA